MNQAGQEKNCFLEIYSVLFAGQSVSQGLYSTDYSEAITT